YANSNRTVNIDEVVIQGAELSGRWQVSDAVSLRANYTHTDSEQKSGAQAGLPLTDSARHMANATLDWQATGRLRLFLNGEARSRRFSDLHPVTGDERYYQDYTVLHLGGAYAVNEAVTLNARINNLLDRDFTTYDTQFADLDGDGVYEDGTNEVIYFDHYNNKDKARSVWLSVNVRFRRRRRANPPPPRSPQHDATSRFDPRPVTPAAARLLAAYPAPVALDQLGRVPGRDAAVRADRNHPQPRGADRGRPAGGQPPAGAAGAAAGGFGRRGGRRCATASNGRFVAVGCTRRPDRARK